MYVCECRHVHTQACAAHVLESKQTLISGFDHSIFRSSQTHGLHAVTLL